MNSQNPQKIYPRSPRYVLQLNDKKIVRYAPFPRGNRSFFTDIHNLSETGMAFTVPYLDTPNPDEVIMVEFTPPGGAPVACFAQVKRIQNYLIIESDFFQKNCKLVAVRFVNLQDAQVEAIRHSLDKEFQKKNLIFSRQQIKMRFLWMLKFKRRQLAMSTGAAAATLAFFGLMIKLFYFA